MNIPNEYITGNPGMDVKIAKALAKGMDRYLRFPNGSTIQIEEPKKSKYSNIKTIIDSVEFDSLKEAKRYSQLKHLEKSGLVSDIELQPVFVLQEAFTTRFGEKHRAITYRADFRYKQHKGKWFIGYVVEDVKGMRTELYKLKKKLLLYKYPDIIFRES